jgi:hypothetical protein
LASQIQILFGGVDYTKYVDLESVSIQNNMVMTSDTGTVIVQLDGELSRPKCGQEFIWHTIDSVSGLELTRDFGGVAVTVQEDTYGTSLVYTITVKSYDHWFNRHLVVYWFNQYYAAGTKAQLLSLVPGDSANINNTVNNGNGDGIVNRIVENFCPGFTCNNVQAVSNTVIPQYFNYVTPSDAIKAIADQLEYGYYIDYYKDLHFYSFENFRSPLPNNTLDVDNDLVNYGDLEIIEDGQQTYNKVFLKGFKTRVSTPLLLTFLSDGSSQQWSLGYRVSSFKGDIAVAVFSSMSAYTADTTFQTTGVTTGGTQMTIARDIVDGAPGQASASNTAYIQYTQYLLRLPNYNGAGIMPTGKVIGVYFHYLKDVIYMGQDMQAQATIAAIEGTDGCYEYAVDDKSLTNSTIGAPQAKAQLLLQKYRLPQISGTFTSYLSGWRAGQSFQLVTTARMGGVNQRMYVLQVTKSIISNVDGTYVTMNQIQFANSPYLV